SNGAWETMSSVDKSTYSATVRAGPSCALVARASVYWACGSDSRIELDLAKCAFVIGDVLLQDRGQRFGLLRAQVNALKISDLDLAFRLLLHGTEHQEEIPNIDAHLHAVGIGLAVIGSTDDVKIWLRGKD